MGIQEHKECGALHNYQFLEVVGVVCMAMIYKKFFSLKTMSACSTLLMQR